MSEIEIAMYFALAIAGFFLIAYLYYVVKNFIKRLRGKD